MGINSNPNLEVTITLMVSNPWLNGFFPSEWLRNRNFPNVCFQWVFCRMVFCRTELISLLTFAEYKLPIVRFPSKLFPITQFPNIFCRIFFQMVTFRNVFFAEWFFAEKLRNVVAEWPTLLIGNMAFSHKKWLNLKLRKRQKPQKRNQESSWRWKTVNEVSFGIFVLGL